MTGALPTAVGSCYRATGPRCAGFSSCGTRARRRCGSRALEHGSIAVAHGLSCAKAMLDLPGSGIELMFPALAGVFFTTEAQVHIYVIFKKIIKPCMCE